MILSITGKDNKNLKLVRQLRKKSVREAERCFVAEGRKMVLEALEYVPQRIEFVVVSEDFCTKDARIVEKCAEVCERIYSVPENIFDGLSDTDTPQGILAVIKISDKDFVPTAENTRVLVLDGVSEPGNMGTIIRTAEAFGFDGIYLMKGCTDIYAPKTVRSTMGSIFRMKFSSACTALDIENLKECGFSLVVTALDGAVELENFKVPEKIAVVIGNEAHGVCDEIKALADYKVKISMDGLAESLNAAVAAGITMHWVTKN